MIEKSQEEIITCLQQKLEENIKHCEDLGDTEYFEGKVWAFRSAMIIAGFDCDMPGLVEEIRSKIHFQKLLYKNPDQAMMAVF